MGKEETMQENKALLTIRGVRGSRQNPFVITLKVPKEYCNEVGSFTPEALPEGVNLVEVHQCEWLIINGIRPNDYGFEVEIRRFEEMTEAERDAVFSPRHERKEVKMARWHIDLFFETDEDGTIAASCPALPGCHSQGRTLEESVYNIAEALMAYMASVQKHDENIQLKEERDA